MPYDAYSGDNCTCGCCFSIQYAITGLPTGGYETYFHGDKIEVSNDHYQVVQPTSEMYKGKIVNRTNRYGFKEDIWLTFHKNGNIKTMLKYPESQLKREWHPISEKKFYPSGQLSYFSGNDTTQYWYKSGALVLEIIRYKVGDTTYQKEFSSYDKRHAYGRSLERSYRTTLRSELDPEFKKEGTARETVYKEEYFKNGKLKFRFGKDTTYTWHANGKIASRQFKKGKIEYDADGIVTTGAFHWKTKGPTTWGDVNHSLYATIGRHGKVHEIHYTRDEFDQGVITTGQGYYWTWNEAGKLTRSPAEWKEPLPWKKFDQLSIP